MPDFFQIFNLLGQVKTYVAIRASILKDQEITVAWIGPAKHILRTYDFQLKNIIDFWASKDVIRASVFYQIFTLLAQMGKWW